MAVNQKLDVVVIYGGRSTEHEVSCRSAAFVLKNLDQLGHRVYGIGIAKTGQWFLQNSEKILGLDSSSLRVFEEEGGSILDHLSHPAAKIVSKMLGAKDALPSTLVVFPVIHGTGGEDGSLQGILDYGEIPYVGPDVMGSAIGMDKVIAKMLVASAGVPVVPSVVLKKSMWEERGDTSSRDKLEEFSRKHGFPLFVKPARLGSSVGVTKVTAPKDLALACSKAFEFDDKILVEKAITAREIEVGVLGRDHLKSSCPGEVVVNADFYSFEAKYLSKTQSQTQVPAKLSQKETAKVQELARLCYEVLDLQGMARVDFFLDQKTNEFMFNEVNTIPGFTEISLFPLMWRESGLNGMALVSTLLDLALERHQVRLKLNRLQS
jgi:D-alanine-D-alanine ligase